MEIPSFSDEQASTAQDQPTAATPPLLLGAQTPARPNPVLGKPLTAKQQTIYDLSRPFSEGGQGKKRIEVAAIMGISVPVVSKTLAVVYRKLGFAKRPGSRYRLTEVEKPEKAAAIIDAITEPEALVKLKQAYKECGLPEGVSSRLLSRLRTKYFGAITQTRNLKASEIAQLFSEKIDLAARYMDDKTAGEASFRDLALAATAMAEKRQLMRGEPTQIISDHERAKLHELVPLLIQEAQRRGLTVEGQVLEKVSGPA